MHAKRVLWSMACIGELLSRGVACAWRAPPPTLFVYDEHDSPSSMQMVVSWRLPGLRDNLLDDVFDDDNMVVILQTN